MKKVAKKELLPVAPYFAAMVPNTWLDPLLTGPKAVIGAGPYTGTDIENLLRAVRDRIKHSAEPQSGNQK